MFNTPIISFRNQGDNIAKYWIYRDDEMLKKFSHFMNLPIFTVGQLPISSRVMNHWKKSNILPDGSTTKDGLWRKFTFVERVWIGAVAHLREFGVPLNKIVEAKKHILKYDKKLKAYALFEYYISRSIASTDDPYLIMMNDGVSDVGTQEEIEIGKTLYGSKDMILISLKAVLKSLGEYVKDPEALLSVSKDEIEILKSVRLGLNDEISIKMNNGKISETQISKTEHGKPNIKDIINNLKKDKSYAEVLTKFQDGNPEMVKVIKKIRSKNKPSE